MYTGLPPWKIYLIFGTPCNKNNLVTKTFPLIGKATCHRKIFTQLYNCLNEIDQKGLGHLIKTYDGIYNCRVMRGSKSWSRHAWGIAIDLNFSYVGGYPDGTPTRNEQPVELTEIFYKYGFHTPNLSDDTHYEHHHFVTESFFSKIKPKKEEDVQKFLHQIRENHWFHQNVFKEHSDKDNKSTRIYISNRQGTEQKVDLFFYERNKEVPVAQHSISRVKAHGTAIVNLAKHKPTIGEVPTEVGLEMDIIGQSVILVGYDEEG